MKWRTLSQHPNGEKTHTFGRLAVCQRKRDDNKNKIRTFQGGVGRVAGRKIVQNAIFHGKRHDNKILKVKILLSRNFVVMAQAPSLAASDMTQRESNMK